MGKLILLRKLEAFCISLSLKSHTGESQGTNERKALREGTRTSGSVSSKPAHRTALRTAAFTQSCLGKKEVGTSSCCITVCANARQTINTYIPGQG